MMSSIREILKYTNRILVSLTIEGIFINVADTLIPFRIQVQFQSPFDASEAPHRLDRDSITKPLLRARKLGCVALISLLPSGKVVQGECAMAIMNGLLYANMR